MYHTYIIHIHIYKYCCLSVIHRDKQLLNIYVGTHNFNRFRYIVAIVHAREQIIRSVRINFLFFIRQKPNRLELKPLPMNFKSPSMIIQYYNNNVIIIYHVLIFFTNYILFPIFCSELNAPSLDFIR